MSHYPSPYQPQNPPPQSYGYYQPDPYAHLKAPAKRASILMFVLGGLLLLLGACNLVSALITPAAKILESQQSLLGAQPGFDPETNRVLTIAGAAITLVLGLTTILLGTLVRKGSMAATIITIVLASLVLLFCLLMVVVAAIGAVTEPVLLAVGCIFAIPLALVVLLLVWLIQATRNASQLSAMQAQYQMQYWQYQQQQQAYQQQQYQQSPQVPPPPPPSGTNE